MTSLTKQERLFIWFFNTFLFVGIFKKYWPVGGSYWNKKHINPNNKYDLEKVIDDANEYTRLHANVSFMVLLYGLIGYIFNSFSYETKVSFGTFAIGTIYAFGAQHYNRILARNKLNNIPKENNIDKDEDEYDFKNEVVNTKKYLSIQLLNNHYYITYTKLQYRVNIDRYFVEKNTALKFVDYIVDNYNEDEFLQEYYIDKFVEVYKKWIKINIL